MKQLSIMLMALLLSMCMSSCGDEEKDSVETVPNAEFHFQFSSFILRNGETLTITPTIVAAKSSPGLTIRKAGYYWDGELISVVDTPPFTLEYAVKNQIAGSHSVIISLICGGDDYVEMKGTSEPYEVAVVE